jgi:mono/diheme cytochrome c family protein
MGTMLKFGLSTLVILAMALIFCVACGDDSNVEENGDDDAGGDSDAGGDPGAVSYQSNIQPIFDASCTLCHGSSGGLSLASYDDLMLGGDNAPAIEAGNADDSLLVQRIDGTVGTQMPLGGILEAGEITAIRTWIDEGAKDN